MLELTLDDADELEALRWRSDIKTVSIQGMTLEYVDTVDNIEERRWVDIHMMVLRDTDTLVLYGFCYETPASELQEGQEDWAYINPELIRVKEIQVTTWEPIT